jgi:predicted secreted protein
MAQAKTFRRSCLRLLLGDGAAPAENFAAPCGLLERALTLSKELGETNVPDCADEDAAPWTERDVTSKSASISGSGVLDEDALPVWRGFYESDDSKNCRIELWRNGAKVGHWQGAFHIETFNPAAPEEGRVTLEISLQSDGAVTWTSA